MVKFIRYCLLFFCFFPFIGINIGTDTQPFALLCAIVLIITSKKIEIKNNIYFMLSVLSICILTIISLFKIELFQILKRLFSYVSILLIPIAVYNSFSEKDKDLIERMSKAFISIWFTVGALQTFINSSFLTFLIPLYRTSARRGVCSLASEPSFYGYMCFLFFLITLDYKKNRILYWILILIQVVVFAKSAVTISYFIILFTLWGIGLLIEKDIKSTWKLLLGIIVFTAITSMIRQRYADSRMVLLMNSFIENPLGFAESDVSVAQRLNAIAFSFSRYGIPYYLGTTVIMSGFGGAFFEMGFLSLFLIYPIIKTISSNYDNVATKVGVTLSILICMFSAINLSSPMFAFFIGYCSIRTGLNSNERNQFILPPK